MRLLGGGLLGGLGRGHEVGMEVFCEKKKGGGNNRA